MIKWFKNLSMKYKFIIVFIFVITFMISTNLVAIKGMRKMNSDARNVYNNDLDAIEEIHEVNENLLDVDNLVELIVFGNGNNIENVKNEINGTMNIDNSIFKDLEKQNITKITNPYYSEFKSYLQQERTLRNAILDKTSIQDYQAARQIYNQYKLINGGMYDRLAEAISLIQNNALSNYHDNISTFDMVYRNILILSFLEFILLAVFGVIISNHFTTRLNKYVKFATQIAKGSIDDFLAVDSYDEIGVLGEQLNTAGRNIEGILEELRTSESKLKEQLETLQETETKLKTSEERYRLVVEGVNDGIFDIDFNNSMIYLSNRCKDILNIGISEGKKNFVEMKEIINGNGYRYLDNLKEYIMECIQKNKEYMNANFKLDIDQSIKYILFRGKILRDENGTICRFTGSVTDVTEQNTAADKVKYLAYYDTLTNLPNKTSLWEEIPQLIEDNNNNMVKSLVLIDIDDFRNINEVYGHEIGDELILEAAERLKKIKGIKDILYYLGSASFALYSDKYSDKNEIEIEAEKISKTIRGSYLIRNNKINITVSIGVSYMPTDEDGRVSILKNAESALNYCKSNNKNAFVFYTSDMEKSIKRKVTIFNDLINAVENQQFVLYYQPKVSISSGRVEGMEALVRWNHPVKGIIPPNEFISIAEQTGIIIDIGCYVIKEACTQIRKWNEKGCSNLKMAINLSIKQIMQVDFVEKIQMILETTEVLPEWLEFEITESLVMSNYDDAILKITALRNLGITIALDDFGTGYSSLNYLGSLPIDSIKLDKTFIDKIIEEDKNRTIIQSFILLAHSIKLGIVAEGVETEEQFNLLKQLNCDSVQGYFFSKPLGNEEFEKLVAEMNYE